MIGVVLLRGRSLIHVEISAIGGSENSFFPAQGVIASFGVYQFPESDRRWVLVVGFILLASSGLAAVFRPLSRWALPWLRFEVEMARGAAQGSLGIGGWRRLQRSGGCK